MSLAKSMMKAAMDHKAKVSGPHFLLSAENPKYPHKDTLKMGHEKVLHHLRGAGYDAHEVQGHYGAPEKSIIIYGVDKDHADKLHGLAARMGQDSSIHSTGEEHEMRFHHGDDAGKKVTGKGTNWHAKKPGDFFTSLPGGQHHFTHNFDFGKTEPMAKAEDSIPGKLVHYSSQGGLAQIDPKFRGKGVDRGVKGRDTEHPHSFFYREGTEPEHVVTSRAAHKYTVHHDESKQPLYDIGADKEGYVAEAVKQNQGVFNMEIVHSKLKEKGFHGFHNSSHPTLKNVVVMYHPMDVKEHAKL